MVFRLFFNIIKEAIFNSLIYLFNVLMNCNSETTIDLLLNICMIFLVNMVTKNRKLLLFGNIK